MTHKIDRFLIGHGFEAKELGQLRHRPVLYAAIIAMAGTSILFFGLAIAAWT